MKHQQVVPDYVVMLESSVTILALVACGWLLFKLVSACIWFPQYMKNLEKDADKANDHLEQTLMPKGLSEDENEEEVGSSNENQESTKEAEKSESEESTAETEKSETNESKKEK